MIPNPSCHNFLLAVRSLLVQLLQLIRVAARCHGLTLASRGLGTQQQDTDDFPLIIQSQIAIKQLRYTMPAKFSFFASRVSSELALSRVHLAGALMQVVVGSDSKAVKECLFQSPAEKKVSKGRPIQQQAAWCGSAHGNFKVIAFAD